MIRKAQVADKKEINKLRAQVQSIHANARPDIFRKEFTSKLEKVLDNYYELENADALVYEKNEKICGFMLAKYIITQERPFKVSQKILQIDEIGVDEKYRHNGIGKELIDFAKNLKSEKGLDVINLDMWEFNQNALKFYEAMGFTTYRRYLEIK